MSSPSPGTYILGSSTLERVLLLAWLGNFVASYPATRIAIFCCSEHSSIDLKLERGGTLDFQDQSLVYRSKCPFACLHRCLYIAGPGETFPCRFLDRASLIRTCLEDLLGPTPTFLAYFPKLMRDKREEWLEMHRRVEVGLLPEMDMASGLTALGSATHMHFAMFRKDASRPGVPVL